MGVIVSLLLACPKYRCFYFVELEMVRSSFVNNVLNEYSDMSNKPLLYGGKLRIISIITWFITEEVDKWKRN